MSYHANSDLIANIRRKSRWLLIQAAKFYKSFSKNFRSFFALTKGFNI